MHTCTGRICNDNIGSAMCGKKCIIANVNNIARKKSACVILFNTAFSLASVTASATVSTPIIF